MAGKGWDKGLGDLPHAVEAIVGAINGQHRSTCVCLRHAPIPLEDDHFGPDLVIDLGPLVQDFLNVFLEGNKEGLFGYIIHSTA